LFQLLSGAIRSGSFTQGDSEVEAKAGVAGVGASKLFVFGGSSLVLVVGEKRKRETAARFVQFRVRLEDFRQALNCRRKSAAIERIQSGPKSCAVQRPKPAALLFALRRSAWD
jgi:hypothetical protein